MGHDELARLTAETLAPLAAGALVVVLLAARTARRSGGARTLGAAVALTLREGALVAVLVAQVLLAGVVVYVARREGFHRAVDARITSVTTVMHRAGGGPPDETTVWIETPARGEQSLRFAGRVREACGRGDVLHKPAWSWSYTCGAARAAVDAAGMLQTIAATACALLAIFLMRLDLVRRRKEGSGS